VGENTRNFKGILALQSSVKYGRSVVPVLQYLVLSCITGRVVDIFGSLSGHILRQTSFKSFHFPKWWWKTKPVYYYIFDSDCCPSHIPVYLQLTIIWLSSCTLLWFTNSTYGVCGWLHPISLSPKRWWWRPRQRLSGAWQDDYHNYYYHHQHNNNNCYCDSDRIIRFVFRHAIYLCVL